MFSRKYLQEIQKQEDLSANSDAREGKKKKKKPKKKKIT
jgi:hypothetical protein